MTDDPHADLMELEHRVTRRWLEKAETRTPQWELPRIEIDTKSWAEAAKQPLPPGTPQFPREHWVSYPARRVTTLILCDRMLDFDLDDTQWAQVCFLMQYGGKERIA